MKIHFVREMSPEKLIPESRPWNQAGNSGAGKALLSSRPLWKARAARSRIRDSSDDPSFLETSRVSLMIAPLQRMRLRATAQMATATWRIPRGPAGGGGCLRRRAPTGRRNPGKPLGLSPYRPGALRPALFQGERATRPKGSRLRRYDPEFS